MAVFQGSTHALHWIFSPKDVLTYRQQQQQPHVELDHEFLLQYYTREMQRALTNFKQINPSVLYAAVTYLRRFYLKQSFLDFVPEMLFSTCIYLASKSEETHLKLVHLFRACYPNINLSSSSSSSSATSASKPLRQIAAYEVTLMETLQFELLVFHPFRALEGFLEAVVAAHHGQSKEELRRLHDESEQVRRGACDLIMTRGIFSDMSLLYRPQEIAFAAMIASAQDLQLLDSFIQPFLSSSSSSGGVSEAIKELESVSTQLIEQCLRATPLTHEDAHQDVKYQQKKQEVLALLEQHCVKENLYGTLEWDAAKQQALDELQQDESSVIASASKNTLLASSSKSSRRKELEEELLTGGHASKGGLFGGDDEDEGGTGEFVIQRASKMDTSA